MNKYELYLKAKQARTSAEQWQALPESKHKYSQSAFDMSPAHGKLLLMRCGQHSAGGQNYWESPKELNAAILSIIARDPAVILAAIEMLKDQERRALVNCEEWNAGIAAAIEEAKSS